MKSAFSSRTVPPLLPIVQDGHTLVLAGGSSHFYVNPIRGQVLQPGAIIPTNAAPTHLLIFVTPTLIDPAGNRINPPE